MQYTTVYKAFSNLVPIGLCILACFSAIGNPTKAQITSDDTVNTQVDNNGKVSEITGGETRNNNLFHSFQEFSVGAGNEAFFNNPEAIENIFSRVTGGNVSTINGLIRANGSANLFLINPAGIIFGEGARLDIGGSFLGSTADSILFEEGEFSATDLDNPPLLTVNAPVGLNFRDNPGEIINRSIPRQGAEADLGLKVLPGRNFILAGGDIRFESGTVTAEGGNIELGGLSVAGTVDLDEDWSLNFPKNVAKADVTLSDAAEVNVRGTGNGNITINAGNLNVEAKNSNPSLIKAGLETNSTSTEAQAGDIIINATDNVTVNNGFIANQVFPGGAGNAGNVTVNTNTLSLTNGGTVDASTGGQGNAGSVKIVAADSVTINGDNGESLPGFPSGAISGVGLGAKGNAGDVTITTGTLSMTNGGRVIANTLGQGNAGSVKISATDTVIIDGEDLQGFSSGAGSVVIPGAKGNAGDVTITTGTLSMTNGGRVEASTLGEGNAGSVKILATDTVIIDGENSQGIPSGAKSGVDTAAIGSAGGVSITTNSLKLANGGTILARNYDEESSVFNPGTGEAGNIDIKANSIDLADEAKIDAATQSKTGNSANINLQVADNITLRNNSVISAQAFNNANGGNLTIDTDFIVAFPDGNNDILAFAQQGQGGNITINAESLFGIRESPLDPLTNNINASSEIDGLDGSVIINSPDIDPLRSGIELPSKIIAPEQTISQVCNVNREVVTQNKLNISGRGGMPSAPNLPLDSQNISINDQTNSTSANLQPLKTSQGEIKPARGIKVTESGRVILTAYRTNNSGNRLPEIKLNCG